MKKILSVLVWMLLALAGFSQNLDALMKKGDQQENGFDEQGALKTYQQALKLKPTHVPALVKCSELCSRLGFRQEKPEARDDYYRAARKYAEVALKVNEESPDAHIAMAIAMGRVALVAGAKDKVAAAKDIKVHAEKALEYDKDNFKAYHILGKWHLELCALNAMERTAIKVFFGGMPKASLEDAIRNFEKTLSLEPKFLLNYLELAKAYERSNEKKKAVDMLRLLLRQEKVTEEDDITRAEASALLKKWE